ETEARRSKDERAAACGAGQRPSGCRNKPSREAPPISTALAQTSIALILLTSCSAHPMTDCDLGGRDSRTPSVMHAQKCDHPVVGSVDILFATANSKGRISMPFGHRLKRGIQRYGDLEVRTSRAAAKACSVRRYRNTRHCD